MTALIDLSPALALHIVDRMGSTGQPPERGALHVNVGTDALLDVLRDEYLRPMKASGRSSAFKLVQAPFGGGKTQFLHCLRELAWEEGYATAIVGLSPKECPFDRPISIYREVGRRIEMPVHALDEYPAPGLELVLRQIAEERVEQTGAEAFLDWLRTEFAHANVESRTYGRAVRRYLEAVAKDELDAIEILGDFLRGDPVEPAEIAPFRLREQLEDQNAFRWLRSLTQCLSALGQPGVVLMFDEMDRNMSLSVSRRRAIGDNLREMIDYCGQSRLPGVLWCYAVPPEFMDTIVPEYPALAQRLKGASRFGRPSPLQPIIDLDHLPLGATELLDALGRRLIDLFRHAHQIQSDPARQIANMQALARELGERQFESGTRRQFVKAAVSMLDSQLRMGETLLSPLDVRRLAGMSSDDGPGPLAGEVEF